MVPPAAPAAPAVTAGTAQLAIGWAAPADNGSAITGYVVRYKITQRGGWLLAAAGTDTQTTITGLTNDTEYEVQVHAVNAVGRSAWSESSTATPPPPVLTISGLSNDSVPENSVWSATPTLGGSPPVGDVTWSTQAPDAGAFTVDPDSGRLELAPRDFERPMDADGKNDYRVTLRVADEGTSTPGEQMVTVTVTDVDGEAPGTPQQPTVSTASVSSLDVIWIEPSNSGPEIEDYDYRVRRLQSPPAAWTKVANTLLADTRTTITGLEDETTYEVQVRAGNAEGLGTWSASGSGTTDIETTDPDPVLIAFGAARYQAVEGASASVVVRLDAAHGLAGGIDIPIEVSGGTASSGEYDVPASIHFGATDTEAVLLVATTQDTVAEADETIVIAFGSLPASFVAGERTTTVTITDNDSPPPPPPTGGGGGSANRPPVVEAQIEDQRLDAGTVLELDTSHNFYDRERRALTYSAESDDLAVVAVTVDQHGMLTLRGIARGVATVTVTVADHRDERVSQTFAVTVLGPATVWLFPAASDPRREGFVRVINRSAEAGAVRVEAIDDAGTRRGPVTLSIAANETVHFNSDDLEQGSAGKGLPGGLGAGEGDRRLELDSELDFEVLSYLRTEDGFLTAMHDAAPVTKNGHRVVTFNPGSNPNRKSHLRLVNLGSEEAQVMVTGIDDTGASPGTEVRITVPAGAAGTVTAAELETGTDAFEGALGHGSGKWRLRVESDQPIRVMSLLDGPKGHLTNLSTARSRNEGVVETEEQ